MQFYIPPSGASGWEQRRIYSKSRNKNPEATANKCDHLSGKNYMHLLYVHTISYTHIKSKNWLTFIHNLSGILV